MLSGQHHLTVDANGHATMHGIDTGPLEVWYRKHDIVVLKTQGHHYWSGRFSPAAYAPATFEVYRIVSESDNGHSLTVESVVEFPIRARQSESQWIR